MPKCVQCGTDNRDGAKFCIQCGVQIRLDEPFPAETAQTSGAQTSTGISTAVADVGDESAGLNEQIHGVPAAGETRETRGKDTRPIGQRESTATGDRLGVVNGEQTGQLPAPSTEPPFAQVTLEPSAVQSAVRSTQASAPGALPAEERLTAAQDLPEAAEDPDEAQTQGTALPKRELPTTSASRYMLIEIAEQTDTMVMYAAVDWERCWQCGTPYANENDEFCNECGVELDRGLPCRVQVGDIPSDVPEEYLVNEKGQAFWIQPQTTEQSGLAQPILASQGSRLRVGYATDPGQVREVDEDSLLVVTGLEMVEGVPHPSVGLFAVADGMGGHDDGQVASRRVVEVLAEELLPSLVAPSLGGKAIDEGTFEERVCEAIREANRRLTHEARASTSDMGSTLTLALVCDGKATIANVGDSRTYLWHGGILEQLTQDHSLVARLVEKGKISAQEAYTHPRRGDIYRTMGDKPNIEVDTSQRDLVTGDQLVLCCDGVWEMIRDEGIEHVLLEYPIDPQAACDEMVRQANLAGGEDNISVIIVAVQ